MKWEYTAMYHYCYDPSAPSPGEIWDKESKAFKKSKADRSTWDKIKELGEDGWELVSTTFVSAVNTALMSSAATTCNAYYLFMFKRPKAE